jgi:predicted SprT family Zn-dependent metalloprotease
MSLLDTEKHDAPAVVHTSNNPPLVPTDETYEPFKKAFHFFNDRLFGGTLPDCLITLQRKKRALGYFSPQRFEHRGSKALTDEIAMNPDYFVGESDKEILSTLVHEMAHLWQQHFGKPSRGGYHNKEWAEKMDDIGLAPSSTGADGGKRTGQRVSHYIVAGAQYDRACTEFLTSGATIAWVSVPVLKVSKSGKRTKYACPRCGTHVWGKSGLSINCKPCDEEMEGHEHG